MRQPLVDAAPRDYAPWPPDDSEESVAGSEHHQRVMSAARNGLEMAGIADGAAWHVLSQVAIGGFRRPDRSSYNSLLPDVFVHPLPNPHPESGEILTFAEIGIPLLVIEVLSESTWRQDLNDRAGKAWSYAEAGVAEYVAVDYNCRYMKEHVRALRLSRDRWTPWPTGAEGRWKSSVLGLSFAFDGLYLRVYDAGGRLMPLPYEANSLLLERETRLREQENELRGRQEQLQEANARLARLRALAAAGDLAAIRRLLSSDQQSQ